LSRLVYLLDPDPAAREGARAALADRGFEVRVLGSAAELLAGGSLEQGCVLLDLALPGGGAEDVQQALARRGARLPVVVTCDGGDPAAPVRAMKRGAVDVLQKPVSEPDLVAAVERALAGSAREQARRGARAAAAARVERLSRRERQVLEGLLAGLSNKEIARSLDLSPRTVEMHRANMMATLGAASLPDALRIGIDAELPAPGGGVASVGLSPEIAPLDRPPQAEPEAIRSAYEEKLRLALEASGDGAWDWDIASGRIELSPSLIERIGLAYGSLPERLDLLEALMHPDDRDTFYRRLDDHLQGRSAAFACEYRLRNQAGAWRWTEVRGRVVDRAEDGAPLRMVGTARDISGRKADEARASRDQALLSLAQRGAAAAIWDIDLDSGRTHLCARGRELAGLAPDAGDEVALDVWLSRVHPDDSADVLAAIDAAAESGEPASVAFRIRRIDGGWRPVLALGTVIEATADTPRRLVGLTQDLSGRGAAAPAFSLAEERG